MSHHIINQFRKAGIPARIVSDASQVSRAFALGNRRVRDSNNGAFLMDILPTRKGGEEFVINPGTADVQVPSIDPDRQQAILFVREHAHTLRWVERDWRARKDVERVERVPEAKRHFLVGMDEQSLFVCPLSRGVSSVKDAHYTLAPEAVHEARRRGRKVIRQGEFFFIHATDDEVRVVEEHVATHGVLTKEPLGPLGRRGRPHIVDEKVAGLRLDHDDPEWISPREYARGRVRHPDHRVTDLKDWHRVIVNTESTLPASRPGGMTWVD